VRPRRHHLWIAIVLSSAFAPLVFLGGLPVVVIGIVLWGVGFGIQDSLMSAPIATMVHDPDRRGRAFGLFNATYGTGWFLGSCALGALLYTKSLDGLVVVSIVAQLLALPVLAFTGRPSNADRAARLALRSPVLSE
jgi:MFS family permease